ncbi:J domain-containing protein [Nocardioides ultimimeridianus]
MSPNLYDLLDVEESASADEVRAAWKAAIADLEPSDRRFRAFNDAAGVLLDPAKRSAYDEELATARATEVDDEPEHEPEHEPASVEPVPDPVTEPLSPVAVSVDEVDEADDADAPAEANQSGPAEAVDVSDTAPAAPGPALWALAVAGVVALAAVILAVWVLTRPGVDDSADQKTGAAAVAADPSAVERFVSDTLVPAMSYDYRTWNADLAKFEAYMTPTEAAKYKRGWKALGPQVEQQHAVVASHVPTDAPGTGLTRISDDGTRAVVLAFIDQDVRKLATAPFTLKMWATFVLAKDPSTGSWLVDDVCTDSACS